MKLHIGYPATGLNKSIEIDDESKLRAFYDKRMSHEVEGDSLGPEFKGYVFKITGGQDKQGFPMKQGVLAATRVKLLLNRGDVGFQAWRGRAGERRRKSVRGCIVGADLATLNLIIVKKGENDLPGLTDSVKELTRGPKRASKIRKLFNLSKDDDVRKFVVRHKKTLKKGKVITKAPKIQRLVTPERIHRKKLLKKLSIKRRQERTKSEATYKVLLAKRTAEKKAETQKRRKAILAQKRSQDQSNKALKEKERAKIAAVNAARAEAKAAEDKANQAKAAAAAAAAAAQAAKKAEPKKADKPAAAPVKAAPKAEPKKDTKAAAPAPAPAAKKDTKSTKPAEKPTTSQPAKKSTKKSA